MLRAKQPAITTFFTPTPPPCSRCRPPCRESASICARQPCPINGHTALQNASPLSHKPIADYWYDCRPNVNLSESQLTPGEEEESVPASTRLLTASGTGDTSPAHPSPLSAKQILKPVLEFRISLFAPWLLWVASEDSGGVNASCANGLHLPAVELEGCHLQGQGGADLGSLLHRHGAAAPEKKSIKKNLQEQGCTEEQSDTPLYNFEIQAKTKT